MALDGQIAWRHYRLMRTKSAEMGRIVPLQHNKGRLLGLSP